MKTIADHIAYLLIGHDCVIVPGLGAFIASANGARHDADNGVLYPPTRTLAFNSAISHNDGLLVTSVSRSLEINYEKASQEVETAVNSLRHQLEIDGEIAIAGVGRLVKEREGNLHFHPAERPVAALSYSFLPTVSLQRVPVETAPEKPVQEAVVAVPQPRLWVRKVTRIAACALLVTAIGFICSTPRLVDSGTVNKASVPMPAISTTLTAATVATEASETPARMTFFLAEPADADRGVETLTARQIKATERYRRKIERRNMWLAMAEKTEAKAVSEAPKKQQDAPAPKMKISAGEEFCVVVASLTSRERADVFIASKPGDSLKVLKQEGRYRVIAATAHTEEEAKAIATASQKRYPGAWVTKK